MARLDPRSDQCPASVAALLVLGLALSPIAVGGAVILTVVPAIVSVLRAVLA